VEHDVDPAALDAPALDALIAHLVGEERRLSARRTTLHHRIDFLRGGGYAHLDASLDQLRELEAEEHGVSLERRHVHELLDRTRAERRARADRAGVR
jgi:hypothetical protein